MALYLCHGFCNTTDRIPGVLCYLSGLHKIPKSPFLLPQIHFSVSRKTSFVAHARRISSRTGKLERKKKEENDEVEEKYDDVVERDEKEDEVEMKLSELPGEKPDFWEGPQWDGFGFFLQYMWAFGIGFALIACAIAVTTYNEGATDFKKTPAYQESLQSQQFPEEPGASNSDVFEVNPTEEAPTLE